MPPPRFPQHRRRPQAGDEPRRHGAVAVAGLAASQANEGAGALP